MGFAPLAFSPKRHSNAGRISENRGYNRHALYAGITGRPVFTSKVMPIHTVIHTGYCAGMPALSHPTPGPRVARSAFCHFGYAERCLDDSIQICGIPSQYPDTSRTGCCFVRTDRHFASGISATHITTSRKKIQNSLP